MAVCSYYHSFVMIFLSWMIKNNHNLSEGHLAWKSFIMINGAEIREFVYPKNLLVVYTLSRRLMIQISILVT